MAKRTHTLSSSVIYKSRAIHVRSHSASRDKPKAVEIVDADGYLSWIFSVLGREMQDRAQHKVISTLSDKLIYFRDDTIRISLIYVLGSSKTFQESEEEAAVLTVDEMMKGATSTESLLW